MSQRLAVHIAEQTTPTNQALFHLVCETDVMNIRNLLEQRLSPYNFFGTLLTRFPSNASSITRRVIMILTISSEVFWRVSGIRQTPRVLDTQSIRRSGRISLKKLEDRFNSKLQSDMMWDETSQKLKLKGNKQSACVQAQVSNGTQR